MLHFTFFPSQIVISTFLSNAKKNYTFPLAAVFVCWFLVDYNLFNRVSRSYIKGSHSNPHQWKSNIGGKQKIVTLKHLNLAKYCVLDTHCMIMILCSCVCYRMDKHLWVMLSDTISAFWPAHLGWKKYCKYNILNVLYCRYYMLTWVGGKREAWCWPVTGITNTGHQQSLCAWNPTNKQNRIWF